MKPNTVFQRIELEPLEQVMRRVRMGKSKLYAEIANHRFPRPVKVGRGTAFVSSEIDAWIVTRIAERDGLYAQPFATRNETISRSSE